MDTHPIMGARSSVETETIELNGEDRGDAEKAMGISEEPQNDFVFAVDSNTGAPVPGLGVSTQIQEFQTEELFPDNDGANDFDLTESATPDSCASHSLSSNSCTPNEAPKQLSCCVPENGNDDQQPKDEPEKATQAVEHLSSFNVEEQETDSESTYDFEELYYSTINQQGIDEGPSEPRKRKDPLQILDPDRFPSPPDHLPIKDSELEYFEATPHFAIKLTCPARPSKAYIWNYTHRFRSHLFWTGVKRLYPHAYARRDYKKKLSFDLINMRLFRQWIAERTGDGSEGNASEQAYYVVQDFEDGYDTGQITSELGIQDEFTEEIAVIWRWNDHYNLEICDGRDPSRSIKAPRIRNMIPYCEQVIGRARSATARNQIAQLRRFQRTLVSCVSRIIDREEGSTNLGSFRFAVERFQTALRTVQDLAAQPYYGAVRNFLWYIDDPRILVWTSEQIDQPSTFEAVLDLEDPEPVFKYNEIERPMQPVSIPQEPPTSGPTIARDLVFTLNHHDALTQSSLNAIGAAEIVTRAWECSRCHGSLRFATNDELIQGLRPAIEQHFLNCPTRRPREIIDSMTREEQDAFDEQDSPILGGLDSLNLEQAVRKVTRQERVIRVVERVVKKLGMPDRVLDDLEKLGQQKEEIEALKRECQRQNEAIDEAQEFMRKYVKEDVPKTQEAEDVRDALNASKSSLEEKEERIRKKEEEQNARERELQVQEDRVLETQEKQNAKGRELKAREDTIRVKEENMDAEVQRQGENPRASLDRSQQSSSESTTQGRHLSVSPNNFADINARHATQIQELTRLHEESSVMTTELSTRLQNDLLAERGKSARESQRAKEAEESLKNETRNAAQSHNKLVKAQERISELEHDLDISEGGRDLAERRIATAEGEAHGAEFRVQEAERQLQEMRHAIAEFGKRLRDPQRTIASIREQFGNLEARTGARAPNQTAPPASDVTQSGREPQSSLPQEPALNYITEDLNDQNQLIPAPGQAVRIPSPLPEGAGHSAILVRNPVPANSRLQPPDFKPFRIGEIPRRRNPLGQYSKEETKWFRTRAKWLYCPVDLTYCNALTEYNRHTTNCAFPQNFLTTAQKKKDTPKGKPRILRPPRFVLQYRDSEAALPDDDNESDDAGNDNDNNGNGDSDKHNGGDDKSNGSDNDDSDRNGGRNRIKDKDKEPIGKRTRAAQARKDPIKTRSQTEKGKKAAKPSKSIKENEGNDSKAGSAGDKDGESPLVNSDTNIPETAATLARKNSRHFQNSPSHMAKKRKRSSQGYVPDSEGDETEEEFIEESGPDRKKSKAKAKAKEA